MLQLKYFQKKGYDMAKVDEIRKAAYRSLSLEENNWRE